MTTADTIARAGDLPSAAAPTAPLGPADRALVVFGIVAGVALRAYALSGTLGRTDGDEVLSGLMANAVGRDGWPAFLWGQSYGGSLELGPLVLSTRLLGANAVGLRFPVFVLTATTSVVVWRVARRLLPPRGAMVAGLLSWLGPPTAVWYSTREMLFYQPTVLIGMVAVLFVLRVIGAGEPDELVGSDRSDRSHRPRTRDAAIAGLAAGLGWWTSPNIVYLVVPALVVIVVHHRRWWPAGGPRLLGAALGASLVGALPWIVHNLTYNFDSVRASSHFPVLWNYPTRLGWFLWFALPGAVGGRETFSYDFTLGLLGIVVSAVALAAVLAGWWRSVPTRQWDTFALVAYPLLFALVPFGPDQPNMKYQYFLTPIIAVLLARLARSLRVATILVVLAVLVSGVGLTRIAAAGDRSGTPLLLPDLDQAIEVLDRRDIDAVWGDYWIAYRLDWLTDERIAAANSKGIDRYQPYEDRVRAASRSAWVVEVGEHDERLRAALDRLGVPYERDVAGGYVVVVPARPVAPEELGGAAEAIGR